MKKVGNKLEKEMGFPGIYTGKVTWDLTDPKTDVRYIGPAIPPEEWHKITSFFEWTQETARSESQVRLYVNPQLDTWRAWAWPQEGRTGMTSRELDDPLPPEQAALFNADHGWVYFGTVHHHCSGSAFQSGTDYANEKGQDGLHITVGKIGDPHYDLHARFSIAGEMLIPRMEIFWDIGDDIVAKLPSKMHDEIARFQMCVPHKVEFPPEWKENYKEVKSKIVPFGGGGQVVSGFVYTRHNYNPNTDSWTVAENKRIEFAADSIVDAASLQKYNIEKIQDALNEMTKPGLRMVMEIMNKFKVFPWQVSSEMNWLAKRNWKRPDGNCCKEDVDAKEQALLEEKKADKAAHEQAATDGMSEDEKMEAYVQAMRDNGHC